MPTFQAKEKAEFQGLPDEPKPGQKVPQASVEHLRPLGATEFYPRHWQYLHEKHTLDDFRRPGYFGADPLDVSSTRAPWTASFMGRWLGSGWRWRNPFT